MELINVKKIKINPNNPRLIKDENFKKLVKSVIEFPEMLKLRPIVVNEDLIILGGNMRYRACVEAGITEIPIIIAKNLTPEQENEFLIKDNVSGGEWDWDILANEWDLDLIKDWGLEASWKSEDGALDDFFNEEPSEKQDKNEFKIVLEYTEEDFEKVQKKFSEIGGSKENIIYDLLGL